MESDSRFTVIEESPTVQELIAIRDNMGWGVPAYEAAVDSVANCLYSVCVRDGDRLIGLGRVVGDGGLYYYIQDIVVIPEYQGIGLGATIMDKVMGYLQDHARSGATIGLLAAKGKEAFYEKYGFIARPNETLGNGMCRFVGAE